MSFVRKNLSPKSTPTLWGKAKNFLALVDGFLRFECTNSTSKIESFGDYFLTSYRRVFKGDKYEVLSDNGNAMYFTLKIDISDYKPNRLMDMMYIPLLPLSAIGLLLKSIAFSSAEVRNRSRKWERPKKYSLYDDLDSTWTKLGVRPKVELLEDFHKKGVMKKVFELFILNSSGFITNLRSLGNVNNYNYALLGLSECGCNNVSHDRSFSNMRFEIQKLIFDFCKLQKSPVTLLSFGSGNALQDFIIIFLLLKLGITEISLIMVDHDYHLVADEDITRWKKELEAHNLTHEQINLWKTDIPSLNPWHPIAQAESRRNTVHPAFSLLNRSYSGLKLNLSTYQNIQSLLKEHKSRLPRANIVYGVDLDDYNDNPKTTADFKETLDACLDKNGIGIVSNYLNLSTFKRTPKGNVELNESKTVPLNSRQIPWALHR